MYYTNTNKIINEQHEIKYCKPYYSFRLEFMCPYLEFFSDLKKKIIFTKSLISLKKRTASCFINSSIPPPPPPLNILNICKNGDVPFWSKQSYIIRQKVTSMCNIQTYYTHRETPVTTNRVNQYHFLMS